MPSTESADSSQCPKCHDTGWNGPHVFYKSVGRFCTCPAGVAAESWGRLSPAEQKARAEAEAAAHRAAAREARLARRAARAQA